MEIRNKKKVGILSIAVLAGITIIGSSVAYFTSTDTKDNLFTVGSVRTILHEDRWDDLADTDHNGIPDMAEDIIPNKTIPKDPTIENTGKNPAWVYLEVRVPIVNIITAQEDGSRNPKADTELFLFTPDLDHWRQLSKIVEEDTDGRKTAVYVFGYETVLNPGQTTAELLSSDLLQCDRRTGAGGQRTDDHRQEHGHPAGGDRNNGGSLWKLHQPGTCYEGTCTADARRWRSSCG